jgi:hypothetical protein
MIRQILAVCIAALAFPAMAAPAAHLRLWRLDCGTIQISDLNEYSDTFAYMGQTKRLVGSCYLIEHGERHNFWDVGEGLPQPLEYHVVAGAGQRLWTFPGWSRSL